MRQTTVCHDHNLEVTYWVKDEEDIAPEYEDFMMEHGFCDVETYDEA